MNLTNNKVIHVKNGDFQYLQFKRLLKYDNIIKHGYCLKPHIFNMSQDGDNSEISKLYDDFCKCIGLNSNHLVKPKQTHTDIVKCVNILDDKISIEEKQFVDVDGLASNLKNISLATVNADCILLILFDPVKKVIANIHSGWTGTFKKIAVKGIEVMVNNYQSNPKDIICCICPSIRKCHFEVEKNVKDMCENIFEYTGRLDEIIEYKGKKNGVDKWVIDTVLINKIMLEDMGVLSDNIEDCEICSMCSSELVHSKRAEGENFGRGTAVIGLV